MFTQMNAKQGIEMFGKKAVEASFKEFAQLDDIQVFRGVKPNTLSREEKSKALMAIN